MHMSREHWRRAAEENNIAVYLDRVRDRLTNEYANANPYLRDKIEEDIDELEAALKHESFETRVRLDELTRAMRSTHSGDIVRAIDYGIDWGGDFRKYEEENEKAARDRDVHITRLFILPSAYLAAGTRQKILDSLRKTIPKQANNSVKIYVAPMDSIGDHCDFDEFKEGSVLFEYRGRAPVVMYETKFPLTPKENDSYSLRVTWRREEIEKRKEIFDCLTSRNMKHVVKDYDTEEGKALLLNGRSSVG